MKEMRKPEKLLIKDYDYPLPEERIAKYPLEDRDSSKLLLYAQGNIQEKKFYDVVDLLTTEDQLFFNTTRVVQARLQFRKETGAKIEIFCLEPLFPKDHQLAFSSFGPVDFICLVGNAKKWKNGIVKLKTENFILSAQMLKKEADKFIIRFSWDASDISFAEILDEAGSTPIPPYLKRDADKRDATSYQTVYAQQDGSVAAPTAGLHFTENVISELKAKGIQINNLNLHVGAGTFIPVKQENAVNHEMHSELVSVDINLLESLLNRKRKIAIGTTSTRSLESLYWLGIRAHEEHHFSFEELILDQWDAYVLKDGLSLDESIDSLIKQMKKQKLGSFSFLTRIMITPGYQFKVIDGLFTNFHQPKSTLLLLIAALIGDDWKDVYNFALKNDFRFLSYGDSSLLMKGKA